MRGFVFAVLIATTVGVGISGATAPEPALVARPGLWTVHIRFTHPQQIVLRTGLDNKPRRFWYVLLTITNKTGRDVDFYPKCELVTDTFQVIPAGQDVLPSVFAAVKKRHRTRYPFLESLESTDNRILQGEDNARDIAVIWPDFDSKAKTIKIFIAGLSNETAVVEHPVARDKDGRPVKVFLRKTLELTYALEGDAARRTAANLIYKSNRWVMR